MPRRTRTPLAAAADRFDLYQRTVQDPPANNRLVDEVYRRLRARPPRLLREDFCGAAAMACDWVARDPARRALGLDIDAVALKWGRDHNVASLAPEARHRVALVRRDVLRAGPELGRPDVVVAFNNSWALFDSRDALGAYFARVRRCLAPRGMLILQCIGGRDAMRCLTRRSRRAGVGYTWEQTEFNAVTSVMRCAIHYDFDDGSRLERAFEYRWRVWGLAETRDLLRDSGFSGSTVLWPVCDRRRRPTGRYSATDRAPGGLSWVVFIVAVR